MRAAPELKFPAVARTIDQAIRESLLGRGLKTADSGTGPQPLRFTVGMLVIDLMRLQDDAKKLIAKYKGVSD